jgi:hypothetical protein
MSGAEVTDLLTELRRGSKSIEDVAAAFRERQWPATRRPQPTTYAEMAEQQDREPEVPGSFAEVTAAYDRGEITQDQYRTLTHAAADAINAEIASAGTSSPNGRDTSAATSDELADLQTAPNPGQDDGIKRAL